MTPTIYVPDEDDRQQPGGATLLLPDDGRQQPGGATMFVPDDCQPTGAPTASRARGDDVPRTGRTMTDLIGRWLAWRGFIPAASLALALAAAALAVLARSSSHRSESSDAPAVAAEPVVEQPKPAATGDDPRIEARPRCTYQPEGGADATVTVMCAVTNHASIWTRVRVTAWLHDEAGGLARRIGAESALLAPAEVVTVQFDGAAPARAERRSKCDCRVEALR